jgi:hypothetical protein
MTKSHDERPVIFRPPTPIRRALDAEAAREGTNKNVLLNRILAERYGIEYEPTAASARRTTPHGGGPRRAAA